MDTSNIISLFSESYSESRIKFLNAAKSKNLDVQSHILNIMGAQGEVLAIDVVLDGPKNASKILIIISGVHGVEGFCGSAIQTGLLLSSIPKPSDTSILYIHAVNPHGFSYLRRVTQENVDPNRNFNNFNLNLPFNEGYSQIHDALLPIEWPPKAENEDILNQYVKLHGAKEFQKAISLGQYHHPEGMWFGGTSPTWSNKVVREILKEHLTKVKVLASIDIHTGLGPYGVGEKIFASFDNDMFEEAQNWWGEITNVFTGSSTSVPTAGPIQVALTEESSSAKHIGICLEYGTYSLEEVLTALRADHWAYRYGKYNTLQGKEISTQLKNVFFPNKSDWKISVWEQAYKAVLQAMDGIKNH